MLYEARNDVKGVAVIANEVKQSVLTIAES